MGELITLLNEVKPGIDYANSRDLVKDLDSLTIVRLVARLSEEYDVEITPLDIVPENFRTVEAIYDLIKRLED